MDAGPVHCFPLRRVGRSRRRCRTTKEHGQGRTIFIPCTVDRSKAGACCDGKYRGLCSAMGHLSNGCKRRRLTNGTSRGRGGSRSVGCSVRWPNGRSKKHGACAGSGASFSTASMRCSAWVRTAPSACFREESGRGSTRVILLGRMMAAYAAWQLLWMCAMSGLARVVACRCPWYRPFPGHRAKASDVSQADAVRDLRLALVSPFPESS